MARTVKSGKIIFGFIITYLSNLICPVILLFISAFHKQSFPKLGMHDLETIAALPWIAVFLTVPTLPFGLIGGTIFSWAVRRSDCIRN